MKYPKQLLTLLAFGLLSSNIALALGEINLTPNNIPITGRFDLNNRTVTFALPRSASKLLAVCRIFPASIKTPRGIKITINTNAPLTFLSANTIITGQDDAVMFNVNPSQPNTPPGFISFTTDKQDMNLQGITCSIHPI